MSYMHRLNAHAWRLDVQERWFLRALLNYDYAATKSIIFLQFVKFIHAHPGTAHYVLFNYTEGRVRTEVRVPVFHSTPLVEVPDTFRIE
ncbi:hypothetical protein C8J57DRAFT_1514681 [Mycena rebaudengoi]|nr:hypothetical protein C8J57DRAFT_1514681 [Mycena rebaudengoi]